MRHYHIKLRQTSGRSPLAKPFCEEKKFDAYSTEDAVKRALPLFDRKHFDAFIYTDWGSMVASIHGDHVEMYLTYEIIDTNGTYIFKPEN